MEENKPGKEIGRVTHFFDKIGVCVVELNDNLKIGDKISVVGATTNFEQEIESMQVDHKEVENAKKGDAIGLRVKEKVRPNDKVYLVE
jgi:translation elongation factor EF-1alpha